MTIFCPNGHDNPDTNRFCQACGSQLAAPVNHSMTIGVLLGDRYRITREIGRGGFGRTYLCEDVNRFNELCVLKEFAPQVQGTALLTKAQQLFEREAGVMYQLQHPQIPRFREMFRVNRSGVGQLFLVQDYVAGDNYQQILRRKRKQGRTFTEAEITQFLTQILPVLSYIHSLGVIHRDISPDNLISRNSDGLPVLIDFGGVKQVAVHAATQYMGANLEHSEVPTRLGKVGYAPNEQMQRGVVSEHSDLYALAATTLVLLTGKEPPELIDPQNFTWNWREYISLSPKLASILDRMLQLRPHDRFASAQDILTALASENSIPKPQTVYPPTMQPAHVQLAEPQVPSVVAQHKPQSSAAPTVAAKSTASSLIQVIGQTWVAIAGVVGAVGLGWLVASLTSKRPQPTSSPAPNNLSTAAPSQNDARLATSNPIPTPTIGATSIAALAAPFPTVLVGKGVNTQAYGNAVKQVFISQNPQIQTVKTGDTQVRAQVETIANDLGGKLTQHLSSDAIQKIGEYSARDRANWKSQLNKLHLSERALIELTDAKYRSITEYSAQKLGLGFDRFLTTPMGQIYLATMFDRVQAIGAQQAMSEIVFPVGGNNGTVSGTLQPGVGKVYIASLAGGQDIAVDITADSPTKLSIYPPTSKLPAILTTAPTNNWSGKTSVNGYHEFVLVSQSDRPLTYKFKLTAADLKSTPNYLKSKSKEPPDRDKKSLW